jgi:hypothetical protein
MHLQKRKKNKKKGYTVCSSGYAAMLLYQKVYAYRSATAQAQKASAAAASGHVT